MLIAGEDEKDSDGMGNELKGRNELEGRNELKELDFWDLKYLENGSIKTHLPR